MMFFINKADVITTFLKENYNLVQKYLAIIYPMQINFEMFIFQDISALYWLLIPFKSFINTIESDFFPIAYLYPFFEILFLPLIKQHKKQASLEMNWQ